MTSLSRTNKGFTLIELLIVMSIFALGASLVMGMTVDSVSKYKLQADRIQLRSLLKKASDIAYIHELPIHVSVGDSHLTLKVNQVTRSTYEFNTILLEPATISVSPMGVFSVETLIYSNAGRVYQLNLGQLQGG